jgi:hypothetical protein
MRQLCFGAMPLARLAIEQTGRFGDTDESAATTIM